MRSGTLRSIGLAAVSVMLASCAGSTPITAGPTSVGPTLVTVETPPVGATVGSSPASSAVATAAVPTVVPSRPIPTPPGPGLLASTTVPMNEAPAGAISVEMSGPPPIFRPSALSATAGDVTFFLVNDSPARDEHGTHTLAIGRQQGSALAVSDEVKGGRRAAFTVYGLAAGTYAIWCTFPGHAGLGQTGTLVVR